MGFSDLLTGYRCQFVNLRVRSEKPSFVQGFFVGSAVVAFGD